MINPCRSFDVGSSVFAGDGGQSVENMVNAIDQVSPDALKPSDLAVALAELVRRLIKPHNARATAQRFLALAHHLAPDCIAQSLTKSALQLKVTRASLSKVGIQVLEEFRIPAGYHKCHNARQTYRTAQLKAFKAGRHASQVKRKRKLSALAIDTNGSVYGNSRARGPLDQLPSPPAEAACEPCHAP